MKPERVKVKEDSPDSNEGSLQSGDALKAHLSSRQLRLKALRARASAQIADGVVRPDLDDVEVAGEPQIEEVDDLDFLPNLSVRETRRDKG
jgi:hypothetical protein